VAERSWSGGISASESEDSKAQQLTQQLRSTVSQGESVLRIGRLGRADVADENDIRRNEMGHPAPTRTTLGRWGHRFGPRLDCWVRQGSCPMQ
jgi:hypothetical protein